MNDKTSTVRSRVIYITIALAGGAILCVGGAFLLSAIFGDLETWSGPYLATRIPFWIICALYGNVTVTLYRIRYEQ